MALAMRKIPVSTRMAAFGAILSVSVAFSISSVQAQIAETNQPYAPSGYAFDPNKDGSKVVIGSQSEIERRADVYEAENYRRQLEAQVRREYLSRFAIHDFNRPFGSYNDY